MDDVERYRAALKQIAEYQTTGPTNEWSEAEAFHAVQEIAEHALDPGLRDDRIKASENDLAAVHLRVGSLRRGRRYFYVDHHGTLAGAWVRFIKGDEERPGIVMVEIVELVGKPLGGLRLGEYVTVHVSNLQSSPGVPLRSP